jgi:hypothetical protein
MVSKIGEFILNTPEKYWIIINGHHLHKSFFGVIFILIGVISLILYRLKYSSKRSIFYTSLVFLIVGVVLLVLSISGNVYTNNLPYFKLVN